MAVIKINGGNLLKGEIKISGAKNSVVALIPASILCDEVVSLVNVPLISDVLSLEEILSFLNVNVKRYDDEMIIDSSNIINKPIPLFLSNKLRASYYFMGALLGRGHKVDIYFPGGCTIGKRPIDLHLKGFRELGATVVEMDDHFIIEAKELVGNKIYLDVASVGATINIMLAAVKARGVTVIENAAKEPEIINVATLLNSMGAKVKGAGTNVITITGVNFLHRALHEVIPDRIEAGTYLIIGSLLGNPLKISNIIPSHIESLICKLQQAGVKINVFDDYLIVESGNDYKSIDIKTAVYPGYPTDLQQPIIPFLTQCNGISKVEETIYENRFMNIPDIVKMGGNIVVQDNRYAIVKGKSSLKGGNVAATDLRGGASLLICGLIADGVTRIDNIKYILRGYDQIVQKLKKVGAEIEIVDS